MKKLKTTALFGLLIIAFSLIAFTPKKAKKAKKEIGKFVFIPQDNADSATASAFAEKMYFFKTEVTNLDYQEFLADVAKNQPDMLQKVMVDSANWKTAMAHAEAYIEHYHQHPAFATYPVLNISRFAAEQYCMWLQNVLSKTYLKDIDGAFEVRLPTQQEWQYAAGYGMNSMEYPWGTPSLYKNYAARCNFNDLSAQNIYTNYETGTFEVRSEDTMEPYYTTVVGYYDANILGLYDMSGNVAEMVAERGIAVGGHWNSAGGDVKITSEMPYDGNASCYVGFRPVLVFK